MACAQSLVRLIEKWSCLLIDSHCENADTRCERRLALPVPGPRRLDGSFDRQQVRGAALLTRCARKTSSHGALIRLYTTYAKLNTQRLAVPVAAAPTSSLLLRPTGSFPFSTRSSRLPRCRGTRALARLPPAPQLRGPRSTISPRSRPGKLVELDAFCVPSSSPRGRCHSQKRGALFRPVAA